MHLRNDKTRRNIKVFISEDDNSAQLSPEPKKKPYVVFKLSPAEAPPRPPSQKAENSPAPDNQYYLTLAEYGTFTPSGDDMLVTVEGAGNVAKAIDLVLSDTDETESSSNDKKKLIFFKDKCNYAHRQKIRSLPLKSKANDSYKKIEEKIEDINPSLSRHVTWEVTKTKNKNTPQETTKTWIFKENKTGRSISDIEAFNGFCSSLLLGNRHAKVRSIYDKDGNRTGIVSEKIPNFVSMKTYAETHRDISPLPVLLKTGMAKIWAAALIESENDLNKNNYGFRCDEKGEPIEAVRIDYDQSSWDSDVVSKYAMRDPKKEPKAPVNSFPVTARDILNFPILEDARPYNSPKTQDLLHLTPNSEVKNDQRANLLKEFAKNPEVISDKFYIYLKRILVPDSTYEAIGRATIGQKDTANRLIQYKIRKTNEIKYVLLQMPEFQAYIAADPNIINQICQEFEEYNKPYDKKTKNHFLKIDLTQIRKNFDAIVSREINPVKKAWNKTFLPAEMTEEQKIYFLNPKSILKTFLGIPVSGTKIEIAAYACGGFLLAPIKNFFKFFLEFIPKAISESARQNMHQFSAFGGGSQTRFDFGGMLVCGVVYGLFEGFRLGMRTITSPITSAKEGFSKRPALGILSTACSMIAIAAIAIVAAPLVPWVITQIPAVNALANIPIISEITWPAVWLLGKIGFAVSSSLTSAVAITTMTGTAYTLATGVRALYNAMTDKPKYVRRVGRDPVPYERVAENNEDKHHSDEGIATKGIARKLTMTKEEAAALLSALKSTPQADEEVQPLLLPEHGQNNLASGYVLSPDAFSPNQTQTTPAPSI